MIRVLLAMLACQAAAALAAFTLPVVAPAAARSLGIAAELVGYYTTVMLVGAMVATMVTAGFVRRFGALRVSQATLVFAGLGLGAMPLTSLPYMALPLLVASAVLIGFAYGPANPASSHLLSKVTPPHLRGRVFSIKQTSVPIGGALGGFALPFLEAHFGWQGAALCAAGLCLVLALVLQPWRKELDSDRTAHAPLVAGGLGSAIAIVFRQPGLRLLAAASGAFAAMQFCYVSLFVTFAVDRTGFSLQSVGTALSAGLVVSIGARMLWGWAADRFAPRHVLAGLGLGMAASAFTATVLGPAWPYAAVVALAVGFGSSGTAWQGVYLAEVARNAPDGRVAEATSGCMAATFMGGLMGPGIAAALTALTGSIAGGFLFMGVVTLGFGITFLLPAKRQQAT
jgi:MFS family permease